MREIVEKVLYYFYDLKLGKIPIEIAAAYGISLSQLIVYKRHKYTSILFLFILRKGCRDSYEILCVNEIIYQSR